MGVCYLNRDVVAGSRFGINGCACLDADFVANNLEESGWITGQGVGMGISTVAVCGRKGCNDGTGSAVLGNGIAVCGNIGGRSIHRVRR